MALAVEMLHYLVTGKGILTYSASLAAASVKGPGEIGDSRRAVQHRSGRFKDGRIGAPGRPALQAVLGVDDFPASPSGPGRCGRCRAALDPKLPFEFRTRFSPHPPAANGGVRVLLYSS
jgi:hypothetical protein